MVILVRPEELKGVMEYREAIEVVETAFREWWKSPVLNNPHCGTRFSGFLGIKAIAQLGS